VFVTTSKCVRWVLSKRDVFFCFCKLQSEMIELCFSGVMDGWMDGTVRRDDMFLIDICMYTFMFGRVYVSVELEMFLSEHDVFLLRNDIYMRLNMI
jgi:hypothetical protein